MITTASSTPNLRAVAARIGIIALAALCLALVAAVVDVLTHDDWTPSAVADSILAVHPTGCPRPSRAPERSFDNPPLAGPVHAWIVNGQNVPCEQLMGEIPNQGPVYARSIDGTTDTLMVQLDSIGPDLGAALPVFVACFIGALALGLIGLWWMRTPPQLPAPPPAQPRPLVTPVPERAPEVQPAKPVELAALTTSGISGLTVDRGTSGPFEVYAATQVGFQHARSGNTREDAYAVGGAPESGWVYLAVADGLGSAANSHAAAQRATRSMLALMRDYVPRIDPRNAETEWSGLARELTAKVADGMDQDDVTRLAAELGYVAGRNDDTKRSPVPACTLAFVALGPVSATGYPLLWGAVGDCEVLLVDLKSGGLRWLTHNTTKQQGGMLSNATFALPRDYGSVVSDYEYVPPTTMTVLASDGMADAIRQESRQYSSMLPVLTGARPAEHAFGEIVSFQLPGLHDDRTIVAAWPSRP
jgi:hypothetical protein